MGLAITGAATGLGSDLTSVVGFATAIDSLAITGAGSLIGVDITCEPRSAGAITGGSMSKLYSRSSFPLLQFTCNSSCKNGSRIASLVVTRMTVSPRLSFATANSIGTLKREASMPTRA